MNSEYYNQIAKSTAHRKSRDDNKDFIFAKLSYLKDFLIYLIAFNTKDKTITKVKRFESICSSN